MRLLRLRLRNYRGVVDREVRFAPNGITVIEGENESGKSSMAEAIDLLFDCRDDSSRAAVRAVQPVGKDVGAEVEAEVECGEYHFTYAKRFHRDRSTTLTIHRPKPEHIRGREAHDRVRAILDASLDQPLWRALRVQQGDALFQPDLTSQTSLAAALDEAAQGALGGDHEASLVDRAGAEYANYFTATGRRNAALDAKARAVATAESDLDAARARLVALEDDIERHAVLGERVESLTELLATQRDAVAHLQATVAELAAAEKEVDRLRDVAATAEAQRGAAEALVRERRQLATQVATIRDNLDALEVAQAAESERHSAAAAAARTAREVQECARARRRATQELARLRRDDHAHLHDLETIEAIDHHLALHAHAREAEEEARDQLAASVVDEALLDRIEQADAVASAARAAVRDLAPTLEVDATDAVVLTADGVAIDLARGAQHRMPVTGSIEIAASGATIRIVSGANAEALAKSLEAAERDLQNALIAGGVADRREARAAHRRRAEAERVLLASVHEGCEDDDASLVLRRAELESRAAEYVMARAAIPTMAADLIEARALADEAEADAELAARFADDADGEADAAQSRFDALDKQAAAATALIEQARRQLAVDEPMLAAARAKLNDEDLEAGLFERSVGATEARKAFEEALEAFTERRPDEAAAELAVASSAAGDVARQLDQARGDRVELAARIAVLGDEGLHERLVEAEAALAHARSEHEAWEKRAAAASLLHHTLTRHRDEARQAYVAPLRSRIEELGRALFGPTFAVELADDLSIARRTLDGLTLDFADLSAGTREQLAVLARLACATLVAPDGGGVPVILDDVLGFSDPERLAKLGDVFAAAADCQVIVLTCVPDRYAAVGAASVIRLSACIPASLRDNGGDGESAG